ncbi:MAG: SDR family oxidoreductase [Gammaproteobacteria bacterium]|nr:SDR family oxidoreductase [Gammaproteobacteria bacterium]
MTTLMIGCGGVGTVLAEQLLAAGEELWIGSRRQPAAAGRWFALDVLAESYDWPDALPEQIDRLIYLPGSINLKPLARISARELRDAFELNVVGAMRVVQALLPRLQRANGASITLVSTVAVSQGMGFHTTVAAAKGALEALTRAWAAELAPRIRVNCVAPSLTDTPLAAPLLITDERRQAAAKRHPLGRIGQPVDIASAISWLSSPAASWVTGQVLPVDGGLSSLRQL